MIIEQILVTHMAVFCYLVADEKTREGVLIDPAGDHEAIESVVAKHGITVYAGTMRLCLTPPLAPV